jgi:hypothetical protein
LTERRTAKRSQEQTNTPRRKQTPTLWNAVLARGMGADNALREALAKTTEWHH